tara:strand:- start:1213 stop:1704 length:492 start_codon:yes stop_codon:yes gene_type:complete
MPPTKIIKQGKVVVILSGRYAGKKAIVVKVNDEGKGDRRFGHCLVAGIERGPRRCTRSMSAAKINKRTRMKAFLKFVNYNHIMPTRYEIKPLYQLIDKALKKGSEDGQIKALSADSLEDPAQKKGLRQAVQKVLQDKYRDQASLGTKEKVKEGTAFFYQKLRF